MLDTLAIVNLNTTVLITHGADCRSQAIELAEVTWLAIRSADNDSHHSSY